MIKFIIGLIIGGVISHYVTLWLVFHDLWGKI